MTAQVPGTVVDVFTLPLVISNIGHLASVQSIFTAPTYKADVTTTQLGSDNFDSTALPLATTVRQLNMLQPLVLLNPRVHFPDWLIGWLVLEGTFSTNRLCRAMEVWDIMLFSAGAKHRVTQTENTHVLRTLTNTHSST